MTAVVGREPERAALDRALESSEAELIALYGRRRVGKTFLIREHLREHICFELTGVHDTKMAMQLRNFAAALVQFGGRDATAPSDWVDAFARLRRHLETTGARGRRRVVFLDEVPWLASRRSGFVAAFEHFWNSWASRRRDLVVVLCGSAASWMIDRIVNARGGLHNRVTRRIRMEPFDLADTEAFLRARGIDLSRYSILELYMAMGGIPHYLKEVVRGESAAMAIDRICFAKDGLLRDEFDRVSASLFENPQRHQQIMRVLAARRTGLSRGELSSVSSIESGGRLTSTLEELEASGFILRTPRFGRTKKDASIRVADEYTCFYLDWIENRSGHGRNAWATRRASPAWRAWSGYAFEGICLKHVARLKRALGIEAVETLETSWYHRAEEPGDRGVQIDLVIDRKDATMNVCELKFCEAPLVVDKRLATELRRKREALRTVTGTRKTLLVTLVTTFGVAANKHSREIVDAALTMDALFAR